MNADDNQIFLQLKELDPKSYSAESIGTIEELINELNVTISLEELPKVVFPSTIRLSFSVKFPLIVVFDVAVI